MKPRKPTLEQRVQDVVFAAVRKFEGMEYSESTRRRIEDAVISALKDFGNEIDVPGILIMEKDDGNIAVRIGELMHARIDRCAHCSDVLDPKAVRPAVDWCSTDCEIRWRTNQAEASFAEPPSQREESDGDA